MADFELHAGTRHPVHTRKYRLRSTPEDIDEDIVADASRQYPRSDQDAACGSRAPPTAARSSTRSSGARSDPFRRHPRHGVHARTLRGSARRIHCPASGCAHVIAPVAERNGNQRDIPYAARTAPTDPRSITNEIRDHARRRREQHRRRIHARLPLCQVHPPLGSLLEACAPIHSSSRLERWQRCDERLHERLRSTCEPRRTAQRPRSRPARRSRLRPRMTLPIGPLEIHEIVEIARASTVAPHRRHGCRRAVDRRGAAALLCRNAAR